MKQFLNALQILSQKVSEESYQYYFMNSEEAIMQKFGEMLNALRQTFINDILEHN